MIAHPALRSSEGVRPECLTVCLVTEGSYPHTKGGVSTWCDMLVRGLPEVRFVLLSLVANPSARPVFDLPANVCQLITVPLWGTGEVLEIRRDLGLIDVIRHKHSVRSTAVRDEFVPWFRRFVRLLWSPLAQPVAVGESLAAMAGFFLRRDFDGTMKSEAVWRCFVEESAVGYREACHALGMDQPATLLDVTDAMRLLYRWLTLLTVAIPAVDVVHAAAAGLCSVPGILARLSDQTAFLLTEHGVYLRERLLALARAEGSLFEQLFQARFAQRLTEASYHFADRVTPGSNYNHSWEVRNGAALDRIQTIYNGPDPAELTAVHGCRPVGSPPTIVWLGRIDPLKDIETLLHAASIVRGALPQTRFVLYGQAPKGNEWYLKRCEALRDQLGLRHTVVFGGFAASAAAAYNEGDFAVLSSISEGFPYSVVEAMMCGRTVVGTDVGGVREAIEGCGLVVEPRNPQQLAQACLTLLRDPALCQELGQKARAKAIDRFSLQQCNTAYLAAFQHLATVARSRRLMMAGSAAPAPIPVTVAPAPVVQARWDRGDRL